jgi:deoxyribodipyrimidine photo-lyase
MAAGRALRAPGGPAGRGGVEWRADGAALRAWASGRTGLSFVDACMRELAASGWMSNRGRQNAASLLAKELGHDWRDGARLLRACSAAACCRVCLWRRRHAL